MDNCLICEKTSAKYKCPKCRIKYCSANCFQAHNEKNECDIKSDCDQTQEVINNPDCSYVTEDTIPEHELKLLDNNKELHKILENQHVRDILLEIDKSKDAAGIMDRAMKEPIFLEFADVCLKILENKTTS